MNVLIVGGTGTLGRQLVRTAINEGYNVKCLVRNLRRATFLKDWGAELVFGDLSILKTIPPSLKGIDIVIDAATVRPTDDYSAEKVDLVAKTALIEAAKLAKVKKFIFFSVLNAEDNSSVPLIDLKLKIEEKLEKSGLNYQVFRCSGFFQGLINQYALPILEEQKIWLSSPSPSIAYIDTQDAAKKVISGLTQQPSCKIEPLIGKKFWTSEEIITLCERLSGKSASISYIPGFFFFFLRNFFRFFEFSWNIADRLQFSEVQTKSNKQSLDSTNWEFEPLSLELYLQEYFGKILKKLKETEYQQASSGISF